ncbi:MAG: class I SAM-dependent methyltransferase [Anaerolineae bacterium]|jgi:SAM-dependent methyltransferase
MPTLSDPDYLLKEQYHNASKLDARIRLHTGFSINEYDWFLWVFDQYDLPPQCRILELGCGPGDLWCKNMHRIPKGWAITLSDFSTGMLEQARQNLADSDHRFTFEIIDTQSIPFENGSFDAVIANHMIYHVPDRARGLSEMRRVLKSGGDLYATTVGVSHMRELPELITKFDPELALKHVGEANEFTLENGPAQLAEWFSEVAVRRYEDALHITEAAPLVDYAMSSRWFRVDTDRREEFAEFVGQELALNGGAIRIAKDSGMLVAK